MEMDGLAFLQYFLPISVHFTNKFRPHLFCGKWKTYFCLYSWTINKLSFMGQLLISNKFDFGSIMNVFILLGDGLTDRPTSVDVFMKQNSTRTSRVDRMQSAKWDWMLCQIMAIRVSCRKLVMVFQVKRKLDIVQRRWKNIQDNKSNNHKHTCEILWMQFLGSH